LRPPIDWDQWPEPAKRIYRGMMESLTINGRIIIPASLVRALIEVKAALEEGRIPRAEFI